MMAWQYTACPCEDSGDFCVALLQRGQRMCRFVAQFRVATRRHKNRRNPRMDTLYICHAIIDLDGMNLFLNEFQPRIHEWTRILQGIVAAPAWSAEPG